MSSRVETGGPRPPWTPRPPRAGRASMLLGATVALAACAGTPFPTVSRPQLDLSAPGFSVGVTHDRMSADAWQDPTAVARARSELVSEVRLQNQALMGWGAENPEPSPGVFNWSSLDARMDLISSTGGTAVLTLCGAPDWMKGGAPGTTDWSTLEVAPTPDHYADFADLAVEALRRYPQVRFVQVWNELKGFYDPATNDWDMAAYTELYNTVYRAVKALDSGISVGGPYVVMDSWSSASTASHPSDLEGPWGVVDRRSLDAIDYWLAHAAGADFVTVDGWSGTRDRGLITDEVSATAKFGAITSWIRERTDLPIWWAELHVSGQGGPASPASLDAALGEIARAGARVALLWDPQHETGETEPWLWTDVSTPDGGRSGPYAEVWDRWAAPDMSSAGSDRG